MSHPISPRRRARQRGTWLIEFALCSVFSIPLFLASVGTGISLSRGIQTTQVCRDAGHMYMDQVDFSLAANQKMLGRLAWGLGLASDATGTINTGGNGVIILTTLMQIGATECANAGYTTTTACPNYGKLVMTDRVVVGNSSLRASNYGTPSSGIIQTDGSITIYNYCTNTSVVVSSGTHADTLNLTAGSVAYASEAFFTTTMLAGFDWNGTSGVSTSYAFNFF
jgi:hypothetical protein